MARHQFIDKLREAPRLGLSWMYPAAGIIEGMGRGWDFVWIDGQHGQLSYDSIASAIRAAQAMGLETLVRTPGHDPGFLGQIADLAPSAVMVPMVNTPDEAAACVQALRFAPHGSRSYGGRRVIDLYGREYYREVEPLLVAQTETQISVNNAQQIASTPGVDCLFFGPDDMKVQMGIAINTPVLEHPALREAMQQTASAAAKAGKLCGTVAINAAMMKATLKMGYRLLIGGGDIMFLRNGSADKLKELRDTITGEALPSSAASSPAEGSIYGR